MDQTSNAVKSSEPSPLLTWPIGVQIALGLLITASLFFLLGRWTHAGSNAPPAAQAAQEQPRPGLDLNRAAKAELRLIPGIGDALAQRIVDHRERNGDFRSVDDLRKVSGIGPKTLERIRHQLFVSPEGSFVSEGESEMPMEKPRTSTTSKKAAELTEPIDVNRATQAELQKLPGIGPKLSQRILDERAKKEFKSVDDLRRVPGIGPKTLEKLRPHVTIGSGP